MHIKHQKNIFTIIIVKLKTKVVVRRTIQNNTTPT